MITTIPGIFFVRDQSTGVITRVSVASDGTPANGSSFNAKITPEGRFVVFKSFAMNLSPNDFNA
ncbi:MAG TPA: hypothetical protein VHO69_06730, partial [Phototrophicaceae bacterium]|nr:hypothetical protein [Phototrophicaceae bacterium]